jgi:hypothetical protein
MNKNKRGQITVFVILGLVLLISVGLYFVIKENASEDKPDVPQPLTNKEIASLYEFTNKCLYDVTKDALILAGRNGGFTSLEGTGLKVNPIPYESDVFYSDFYSVPYWYYMNDDSKFSSNKPALCSYAGDCYVEDYGDVSIQKSVESYVLDNIDSCLNNFQEYNNIFDIEKLDEKEVKIQFTEDEVLAELDMPLQITSLDSPSETETELSKFQTELDVPLAKMFKFATEMTQAQIDTNYLENNLLNLIAVYSDLDESMLPPMKHFTFLDYSKKHWFRHKVEDQMRYSVLPFLGLTKFANALNSNPPIAHVDEEYAHFAQGFYNSFIVNLGENITYPFNANVFFPDSDIDFYINNGKELIQGEEIEGMNQNLMQMMGVMVQYYEFNYYISFPVMMQVSDETAFNGEGYDFNFAIEGNIRNNIPATANMTIVKFDSAKRISLDDPSQLVNRTIEIFVTDKHTDEPVEGARILYNCGTDFYLGETIMEDGKAVFRGKAPYCVSGGYFKVAKDDYASDIINFNNFGEDLSDKTFESEIWPVHEKQLHFYKRTEEDVETLNYGTIANKLSAKHELNYSDKIMFNIERINDLPEEDNIPLVGFMMVQRKNNSNEGFDSGLDDQLANIESLYEQGQINESLYETSKAQLEEYEEVNMDVEIPDNYSVDLIPGKYHVEMSMIRDGPFNIPEKNKEICPTGLDPLGVCIGGTETMTLDAINLSSWVTGKAMYNFTINEPYVYNDNDLLMFVLSKAPPTNWDEFQDYDLDDYVLDPNKEWMMLPYYE